MTSRWLLAVAAATLIAACSSAPGKQQDTDLGHSLAAHVTVDAMYGHLRKLQDIADADNGNRAEGTKGYDASVDYAAQQLRDKGFDVSTPEFERYAGTKGGNPGLTVAGRTYPVEQASLLLTTKPGGLSAVTLRPARPAGCAAADYSAVNVRGAIAVVDDTGCSVVVKHNVAVARGAVGLLVVSQATNGAPAGLFTPGYYRAFTVPVGVIGADANTALRRTSAPVRLTLDGRPVLVKSRNVLAQTKTGDVNNVVMAGAHLDSAGGGPGINDDGSGVAAVLETALQLGGSPNVTNAVRFAFWGSEEMGSEGSRAYIRGLPSDQLNDIALYLDFDMLGSPNAGYFTYDGDQSAATTPANVPAGSAGIERVLAGYLNLAGVRPADMPLGDATDYQSFLVAGIPIGGLTAGAAQRKTEVQSRLWGGKAGVAFDPNYHTRLDNIDNIDRNALSLMGSAVGFAVGTYARSTDGVNGVPTHDQRHRNTP